MGGSEWRWYSPGAYLGGGEWQREFGEGKREREGGGHDCTEMLRKKKNGNGS